MTTRPRTPPAYVDMIRMNVNSLLTIIAHGALGFLLVACPAFGAGPVVPAATRFFSESHRELAGETLLRELSCTACHRAAGGRQLPVRLRPKGGPVLDGIGQRVNARWLTRYLLNPGEVRPGTTMPNVLASVSDRERRQHVTALVAFLSSLAKPLYPAVKVSKDDDPGASSLQRGFDLFHRVGCVACHAPDERFASSSGERQSDDDDDGVVRPTGGLAGSDAVESIPLGPLAEKYSHPRLTEFLHDPLRARPAGRMPALKLSRLEAADIAHYLLGNNEANVEPDQPPPDKGLIERGRQLFVSLRCAACHSVKDISSPPSAQPLDRLATAAAAGCLSAEPYADYRLSAGQRQTLGAALRHADLWRPDDEATRVETTLIAFQCLNCHRRPDIARRLAGGIGAGRHAFFRTLNDVDLGDEGRLPPTLVDAGRRLTAGWLQRVLSGEGDIRPHLLSRMPRFPQAAVQHLVRDLPIADGAPPDSEPPIAGDAEAGRELLNKGCIQCHPLRGRRLAGVMGVDLHGSTERLRPEWFREFVRNPASLRLRTRMPTFFPDGRSSVPEILAGNVDAQVAAMWAYLKLGNKGPLPARITAEAELSFELTPDKRPIIQRTFMSDAGTHAIAVGFPSGVHYAFDADDVRLASIWQGRFIDAHGTWYDRFTPPAEPLGNVVLKLPRGPQLAVLSGDRTDWPTVGALRSRGYRLNKSGTPTMLYRGAGLTVEERIEPRELGRLRRSFRLRGSADGVALRLSGPQGEIIDDSTAKLAGGVSIRVNGLQLAKHKYGVVGAVPDRAAQEWRAFHVDYTWRPQQQEGRRP